MKTNIRKQIRYMVRRKPILCDGDIFPTWEDYLPVVDAIPGDEADRQIKEWQEFKKLPRHNISGSLGIIKT